MSNEEPEIVTWSQLPREIDSTNAPRTWADQPEDEIFECTTPLICTCEGDPERHSAG